MRSVQQSPVFRVIRSQRPYVTSARERWKQRIETQRTRQQELVQQQRSAGIRRSYVSQVPQQQERDDAPRDDIEEREPTTADCAPLHCSEGALRIQNNSRTTVVRQSLIESNRLSGQCTGSRDECSQNADRNSVRMTTNLLSIVRSLALPTCGSSSNTTNALLVGQGEGDVTSMDRRFQSMSVVVQQQQQQNLHHKQQQERIRGAQQKRKTLKKERSVATRRRVLMNILGMKRFYKTLSLVREVKSVREKLVLKCRVIEHPTTATPPTPTTTPAPAPAPTTTITSTSTSKNTASKKTVVICKVKFDNLPKSGRDLIARTNLVASIEHTEIERLEKLPWDELILQAQKNLIAYKEWMSMSETRE